MRSRRDGSRWKTISSAFLALPGKSRRKLGTKRFQLPAVVNREILRSWRLSCLQTTPLSLSGKPLSRMEAPRRSCLSSLISGKSLRTLLAKVIFRGYRRQRMLQELMATLKAVGKSPELHQTEDGTRLLILPYGGRILGVFAPGSDENFLWTNSALNNAESARTYYAGDDWQNSGGDRTWLAPEVDFFFPKFPNIDIAGYWQPRSLDPGNYQLAKNDHGVKLINHLNIEGFRSKKKVELEISKSVAPAPNPLRYDAAIRSGAVEYAGHTLLTSLRILGSDPNDIPLVGLWSLTQMPHRGELFIPTYCKSEPRIYFGLADTPSGELVVGRASCRESGE